MNEKEMPLSLRVIIEDIVSKAETSNIEDTPLGDKNDKKNAEGAVYPKNKQTLLEKMTYGPL